MPPSLATYQQQAQAIYEPQKAADITTAKATTAASIANDEAAKPQIQQDYQTAVDNLTQTTNKNVGTINQLYTQRLGGNFSGLQGNDLGMMFADANKQQATIESTRADKLASITTDETNLNNTEIANESSISSKYQGEEQNYADTSYAGAVKEYNTEQQQEFTNQIALAKLSLSQQKAASRASGGGTAPTASSQLKSGGGFNFQNSSGQAISARLYAQLTGTSFNTVLKSMAVAGDSGAADVLKNGASSKAYKALTWD